MPDEKLNPEANLAAAAEAPAEDVTFIDIDDLPDTDEADHDEADHDESAAPTGKPARKKADKVKRVQQVYTLIVQVGRKANDGLPKHATGGALMLYASGVDEAEAVRESVAILKQADLAPLDVQGLGTLDERLKAGEEIDADERELMQRALDENSVVVAQMTPFYD